MFTMQPNPRWPNIIWTSTHDGLALVWDIEKKKLLARFEAKTPGSSETAQGHDRGRRLRPRAEGRGGGLGVGGGEVRHSGQMAGVVRAFTDGRWSPDGLKFVQADTLGCFSIFGTGVLGCRG